MKRVYSTMPRPEVFLIYIQRGDKIRDIADALGVSPSTVWRRKQSLGCRYINCLEIPEYDTRDQIDQCLSCTRPVCPGTCRVIRDMAKRRKGPAS